MNIIGNTVMLWRSNGDWTVGGRRTAPIIICPSPTLRICTDANMNGSLMQANSAVSDELISASLLLIRIADNETRGVDVHEGCSIRFYYERTW